MNEGQRVGVMRALFDRMFTKKKNKIDQEGFKVKHGRGEEVNNDLAMVDSDRIDPYVKAGVAVIKRNYKSESPFSKSKKMLYSSVPEEDRRKKQQVKEEKKSAGFQRIQDVTQTHDNLEGTLGATQTLNDIGAFDDDILLKGDSKDKYQALKQNTSQADLTVEEYAGRMEMVQGELG